MKHWMSCLLGAALGVGGTVVGQRMAQVDSPLAPLAAFTPSGAPAAAPRSPAGHAPAPAHTPAPVWPVAWGIAATPAPPVAHLSQVDGLLDRYVAHPGHLFDKTAQHDLSCLMRQDKQVAAMVRQRLLTSHSADERHGLVRLLAQDGSAETMALLVQLMASPDGQAKRLGFDLLRSLDSPQGRPELARALLAATQQETNPEYLSDLIVGLSNTPMDPATKGVAVQQFQALLASGHTQARASALQGLAQLADAHTLSLAIKNHLHDRDADVRVAAVSAALSLQADQVDAELLRSVHSMGQSPAEPDAVRQLAHALVARAQPQPGP